MANLLWIECNGRELDILEPFRKTTEDGIMVIKNQEQLNRLARIRHRLESSIDIYGHPITINDISKHGIYIAVSANEAREYKDFMNGIHSAAVTDCKTIPENAFQGMKQLNAVELSEDIISIEKDAFSYCWQLETVGLPSSLRRIGDSAFYDCSSLEEITIPESVESIGVGAFADCSSLKKVTLQSNKTKIDPKAFDYCPHLSRTFSHPMR
ncbi:MAG: leucine-rich repeat domain-containing protein [Eggerthellaceae bacterium]|nr:leucine-rich repeat domain-containing protein [Eggerthellaceae bacterium]